MLYSVKDHSDADNHIIYRNGEGNYNIAEYQTSLIDFDSLAKKILTKMELIFDAPNSAVRTCKIQVYYEKDKSGTWTQIGSDITTDGLTFYRFEKDLAGIESREFRFKFVITGHPAIRKVIISAHIEPR
jgi:hypothetical protein